MFHGPAVDKMDKTSVNKTSVDKTPEPAGKGMFHGPAVDKIG